MSLHFDKRERYKQSYNTLKKMLTYKKTIKEIWLPFLFQFENTFPVLLYNKLVPEVINKKKNNNN